MNCRPFKIALITFLSVLLWSACSKDDDPETRSFYMGFEFSSRTPADASNYLYTRLEAESDIISHRFDNGVPWTEALNGQPFSDAIMNDWDLRRSRTSSDQKIYLSVTPLNSARNGLAALRGEAENMALPSPWSAYTFDHAEVKAAYVNYCSRLIDFFRPHYFNMAIEANLVYVHGPEKWSNYLRLHAYVYHQLKAAYPDIVIFSSVEGGYLLEGFVAGNDHVQQRLAVMELMESSDLYAVSFYPYRNAYPGNFYPDGTLDRLLSISHKPLAIAETGCTSKPFVANTGASVMAAYPDPFRQQKYTRDLLKACQQYRAVFVINEAPSVDEMIPYSFKTPSRDAGSYALKGNPRPALMTWREFLAKKHQTQ
jgi:hypothetical protein